MERHIWPGDIQTARRIQIELSKRVTICPLRKRPSLIAGVDAAFCGESVTAVASVFAYPSLIHRYDATSRGDVRFPYIPGLLSFREGQAFISAIKKLKTIPDVIIVDGQGIAHPLGIGIASHIGVLLGIPTIGCAKTRLVGEHAEPGPERGQWTPLTYKKERIGAVLRTRDGVKPVFVSPGNLIDLDSSIEIVLHSLTRYRLPEPIRRADRLSKELSKRNV
ncbi:MAG: endonuclease V [Nitrospiraceae bacterium]|nr:MAG: endonuclease V [Nitrospiraceae bacterium]